MDYRAELIKMIEGIHDTAKLEYMYTFIKLFLEKWGQ